jgi:hypothetical protein
MRKAASSTPVTIKPKANKIPASVAADFWLIHSTSGRNHLTESCGMVGHNIVEELSTMLSSKGLGGDNHGGWESLERIARIKTTLAG